MKYQNFDNYLLHRYNARVMEEKNDDFELETTDAEELHIEDTELEEEEGLSKGKLKKLKEKLKRAEQEKMTAMEDLARARADFLNARRRLDEEKVQDRDRARLQFAEDILPLCDSFDMALNDPAFQELPDNLKKGVLGINMQLSSLLRDYGVEEIGKVGEDFNPVFHEAIEDKGSDDKISGILQKGYKMKDRVVRPAKVIVGTDNKN